MAPAEALGAEMGPDPLGQQDGGPVVNANRFLPHVWASSG